ncbi:MAG: hypothetical protein PHS73_00335 [Candidatus Peribacteraceae bacterium]|nr:hypothetical protein [Candidatus Peribacteraceae bacterium]
MALESPERECVSYEDAQKDERLRQAYLDGIELGELARSVKGLKYDSNKKGYPGRFAPKPIMHVAGNLGTFTGIPGFRSYIHVGPYAFYMSEQDFFATLLVHEGQHATDIWKHPQMVYMPIWRQMYYELFGKSVDVQDKSPVDLYERQLGCIAELRANRAQMRGHNSGQFPLSEKELGRVHSHKIQHEVYANSNRRDKNTRKNQTPWKSFLVNLKRMFSI